MGGGGLQGRLAGADAVFHVLCTISQDNGGHHAQQGEARTEGQALADSAGRMLATPSKRLAGSQAVQVASG